MLNVLRWLTSGLVLSSLACSSASKSPGADGAAGAIPNDAATIVGTGGVPAGGGAPGAEAGPGSGGRTGSGGTLGVDAPVGTGGGRGGSGGGRTTGSGGVTSSGGSRVVDGGSATGSGGAKSSGGALGGDGSIDSQSAVDPTDIGRWTDGPGTCPSGMTQVDIRSVSDLSNAARGDGNRASDPDSVCYLLHDGTYQQSGTSPAFYVVVGGTDASHRRVFMGQSRTGVIIKGRGAIESGANHVQISNLTFDITGYSQSGSFNTFELPEGATDLRIDHVTFTGDCKTGANGGHVEINGATDVVLESCIVENFGRCGPNGHQDHGVYLSAGRRITVRNNDIRGNASRGVLFNTQAGEYGDLDGVTIERNRIHDNGHADYEDGIAMNATDTGTIANVSITNNLIYNNYYSGFRQVGDVYQAITVRNNTFYMNGKSSTGSGRSELNLDDVGSGAGTSISRNIIVAANRVLNNCYDASGRGYALTDNVVQGTVPSGTAGNCISTSTSVDPAFADPANADFHPRSASVDGYGAYAKAP